MTEEAPISPHGLDHLHGDELTRAKVYLSGELRTRHPYVRSRGVDDKCDALPRCAYRGVDVVHDVEVVGDAHGAGVSLVQSVGVHALSVHADDLGLGVDMIDGREQQETAEDGEQH